MPTRQTLRVVIFVGMAAAALAAADWWALRIALLAEDPYENFGLAVLVVVAGLLRSVVLGGLVGWLSRNPGFVIGIVATVATPAIWGGVVGKLPGAVVPAGGSDAILIPHWSFVLILAWTVSVIGLWGASCWPDENWKVRTRNATPFLLAIVGLGLFRVFGAT